MSYMYKGQIIRPAYFKGRAKDNKVILGDSIPVMRIIKMEQPDAIGDPGKSMVLLERVDVELKWRSRVTKPVTMIIKAVMDRKLGLTNSSALDKWPGWRTNRVYGDTSECLLYKPR